MWTFRSTDTRATFPGQRSARPGTREERRVANPGDLERFLDYVRAFEIAQATDAWHLIEPCFALEAVHLVHHGGPLGGEDAGARRS